MDWSIGKQEEGRWPFRVLSSDNYSGLLTLLTEDTVDWRLSAERERRRGPRGNPHEWSVWRPDDPLKQAEVSSKLRRSSTLRFEATYSDQSMLRVNLISNRWIVLSRTPHSVAHQRPVAAAAYVRRHARWWPSLGTTLLLALVLAIVPAVFLWVTSSVWALIVCIACGILSYLLTRPHRGPAIVDQILPFPVPQVVMGTINVTSAIGAVILVVITAVVTRSLS